MERNKVLAKRLVDYRNDCNFTQTHIAKFLGVDQSLVSKVETGERQLSVDMLEKLASLYGIKVSDFESEKHNHQTLAIAFRASDLTEDDMRTISDIQRLALNLNFIDGLTDR